MGPALPSGGATAACVRATMVLNHVLGPNDSVMARNKGTSAWSVLRTAFVLMSEPGQFQN